MDLDRVIKGSDIYMDKIENTMYSGSGIFSAYSVFEEQYKTARDLDIDGNGQINVKALTNQITICPNVYGYDIHTHKNLIYGISDIITNFNSRYNGATLDKTNFPLFLMEDLKAVHPLQAFMWIILNCGTADLVWVGTMTTKNINVVTLKCRVVEGSSELVYKGQLNINFQSIDIVQHIISGINCNLILTLGDTEVGRVEFIKNASLTYVLSQMLTAIQTITLDIGDPVAAPVAQTTIDISPVDSAILSVDSTNFWVLSDNYINFYNKFLQSYESINNSLRWLFSNIVFDPVPPVTSKIDSFPQK